MSIKNSVKSPRFHHLWLPDIVYFEDGSFDKKMFEYFDKLKYKLSKRSQIGRVDAILIEKNKIYTAADPEEMITHQENKLFIYCNKFSTIIVILEDYLIINARIYFCPRLQSS